MKVLGLIFGLLAAPALAETCPPGPDHAAELAALVARAQAAGSEAEGRRLGNEMWALWADAPDEQAQELLDRGMRARSDYDFDTAEAAFDALVGYCPDYAEGYNQRAFVNYLRGQFGLALEDLERARDLSPQHVGVLSGMALTLLNLGRIEAGQAVLREALALNPWIPERGYLLPDAPAQGDKL